MTDIINRASDAAPDRLLSSVVSVMAEAVDEIERLRSALLRSVQYENKCDQTGRSCREKCACQLEAETWLNG